MSEEETKLTTPTPGFDPSPLDKDDGSDTDPNKQLDPAKPLLFKDPAGVDALIAIAAAEATKKGWSQGQVGTFINVAKAVLPGLVNIVAPGSTALIGTLLGLADAGVAAARK